MFFTMPARILTRSEDIWNYQKRSKCIPLPHRKLSGGGVPPMCGDMFLLPTDRFSIPFLGLLQYEETGQCILRAKQGRKRYCGCGTVGMFFDSACLQDWKVDSCETSDVSHFSCVYLPFWYLGSYWQLCQIWCIHRKGLGSSVEASSQRGNCRNHEPWNHDCKYDVACSKCVKVKAKIPHRLAAWIFAVCNSSNWRTSLTHDDWSLALLARLKPLESLQIAAATKFPRTVFIQKFKLYTHSV